MPVHDSRRGRLLAIGGREKKVDDTAILDHFVALCGGEDARITVLSSASSDPMEKITDYDLAFRSAGARIVSFLHPRSRAEANDPQIIAALERSTGVFISGGNQLKLVSELGGSALIDRLGERYASGLHIAGTSAGASALGAVMIARGKARSAARFDAPRMSPGFGLVPRLILDQHFRERDRFGRLLAAVLCNPSFLGVGIDEDTALELDGDDLMRVVGAGSVTLLDGSRLEENDIALVPAESVAGFAGMAVHVLTEGWTYDREDGKVTRPPPSLVEVSDGEEEEQQEDKPTPARSNVA